tara:strand:- start:833 stop:2401 length:1569 start_codon:yes stop_codon:yes gene_type:complete
MKYDPPKPEVLYIPAIFRDIKSGKIRIPMFQRGFVWKQTQLLELLESVHRGYPIGSLLFWNVDSEEMKTDFSADLPFPHPPIEGNVDFVLDGMQRVSSLFGAFHDRPAVPVERDPFAVVYDLSDQVFLPASKRNEACVDLRSVFSPRLMLSEHSRLSELANAESLIDRVLDLQRSFQEYLIPIVRIGDRTPREVVQIFERVNSTGTRLSAVDFMRALTWSNQFDLNQALDLLRSITFMAGFVVPKDTVAKTIALSMGVIPTSEEMLELRNKTPSELDLGVAETRSALTSAVAYLRHEVGALSYDYVPYEGQFLVVTAAAAGYPTSPLPAWLQPWFWRVGFSEAFQGTPDHAVAKLGLAAKSGSELPEQFNLTTDSIRGRPVRKGAALAMTTVAAMATTPARSVFTGIDISETILAGYTSKAIAPIFGRTDLATTLTPTPRTERILSNIVLLGPDERRPFPTPERVQEAILALAGTPAGVAALTTQCIDQACITALEYGDCAAFLTARAEALLQRARELAQAV